jgi:hypothetical protein
VAIIHPSVRVWQHPLVSLLWTGALVITFFWLKDCEAHRTVRSICLTDLSLIFLVLAFRVLKSVVPWPPEKEDAPWVVPEKERPYFVVAAALLFAAFLVLASMARRDKGSRHP